MLVYCSVAYCTNTAHCLIDNQPICAYCIDARAAVGPEHEAWLRDALSVAVPFDGPEWVCKVCFQQKQSMQVMNGFCADCRSTMVLLEPPPRRWPCSGCVGGWCYGCTPC